MAQHIPLEKVENKKLQERAKRIKAQGRISRGSLLWQEVEKNRFVYLKGLSVPESMVCGGRAELEVETDDRQNILEVYLVA
jgi:hypothetical protein